MVPLKKLCSTTVSNFFGIALNPREESSLLRASDFFQDWWAKVTDGAKNGGSFSEMMGPSTVGIWVVSFTYTIWPV